MARGRWVEIARVVFLFFVRDTFVFRYTFFGVCYLVTMGIDRVWWIVRAYEGTWW